MFEVTQDEQKLGALFRLAIRSGAAEAVTLHIRRGEPVNGRDGAGLTPLMLAAVHDRLDVCIRLLDAGANPAVVNPDGYTAVELAVELGHATLAVALSRLVSPQPGPIVVEPTVDEEPALPVDELASPVAADITAAPAPNDVAEEMNGWVADDAVATPSHDVDCAISAQDAQRAMSTHRRISDEADWSDIVLDLPEIRLGPTSTSHGDMLAVEELLADGLSDGFVCATDLFAALDADCGHEIERAQAIVQGVLDDAGILVTPFALAGRSYAFVDPEELNDIVEFLYTEMYDPSESIASFSARARRIELIKREDEERIGRRMDSSLGLLTRALVSLSREEWELVFPGGVVADAEDVTTEEGEDGEASTERTSEIDESEDEQRIDFGAYAALVRSGMAEYGREAMVPRPRPWELSRLLALVPGIEAVTGSAVLDSIAAYEKVRDHLVTANLRLAMSVAYGYRYRGLPLEDLVQDANLGLMRAAEMFDFRRGYKFSTYATSWIRQSVMRSLADTVRPIRVPVHMVEKINAVNRARRELEHGREHAVSVEEIAERVSMSSEAVRRVMRADREVLSLEECGQDDHPGTPDPLGMADPGADPYGFVSRQSLSSLIQRMLGDCKENERNVLVLRFGLDGRDDMTLEEVGKKLELTRERIRQIEAKALLRFRHASRLDLLLPFVGATSLSDY